MRKKILSLFASVAVAFTLSAETVTFNFENETYGLPRVSVDSNEYLSNGREAKNGDATIVLNNLASDDINWRLVTTGLRATKAVEGQMQITVAGSIITALEVNITNNNDTNISVNDGKAEVVAKGTKFNWEGSSNQVKLLFTQTAAITVSSIVITYEADGSDIKKRAGLAWPESAVEVDVDLIEEFTAPVISNPNNLTVIYTSSDTKVATVDESGAVTLTGAIGTTTITATSEETDEYHAGYASYTLTVNNALSENAETVTFDFTKPDTWGYKPTEDYSSDKPLTVGDVTISVDTKAATPGGNMMRFFKGGDFRCSKEGGEQNQEITFSAKSCKINKIVFTGENFNFTADGFNKKTHTWEGSENNVTFTTSAAVTLKSATVTLTGVTTSIEDITVDITDDETAYYNLQGLRVEHPAKGKIYIRVANGKATKIVF